MASGGYRIGSGRPPGAKNKKRGASTIKIKKDEIPEDILRDAAKAHLAPLEYMLKVMNDSSVDDDRRDRMAITAAPFVHARPGVGQGKKADKEEKAKKAGSGRFAASKPPDLKRIK